jgi:hypothetical protein
MANHGAGQDGFGPPGVAESAMAAMFSSHAFQSALQASITAAVGPAVEKQVKTATEPLAKAVDRLEDRLTDTLDRVRELERNDNTPGPVVGATAVPNMLKAMRNYEKHPREMEKAQLDTVRRWLLLTGGVNAYLDVGLLHPRNQAVVRSMYVSSGDKSKLPGMKDSLRFVETVEKVPENTTWEDRRKCLKLYAELLGGIEPGGAELRAIAEKHVENVQTVFDRTKGARCLAEGHMWYNKPFWLVYDQTQRQMWWSDQDFPWGKLNEELSASLEGMFRTQTTPGGHPPLTHDALQYNERFQNFAEYWRLHEDTSAPPSRKRGMSARADRSPSPKAQTPRRTPGAGTCKFFNQGETPGCRNGGLGAPCPAGRHACARCGMDTHAAWQCSAPSRPARD